MDTQKKPPTMREMMPERFTRILAQETGMTDPAAISKLVNMEQYRHTNWPAVLNLAEKTAPEGFAIWAAANPDKLATRAAA